MNRTTRCWIIKGKGREKGTDEFSLDSAPIPRLGDHDVLVKMRGASLNYRDLIIAEGKYPFGHKEPIIAASDGAGEVVETGANVTMWTVGDKVITLFNQAHQTEPIDSAAAVSGLGSAIDGALTEYGVFKETGLVRLPSNLNFVEGATLSCAGLTSWNALYGLRPVRSGDTVLVQGTGGFAKAAGATIIATTSSAEKAEILKQLGADHVINYKEDTNWGATARGLTPNNRGVDHILQAGGPGTMPQSLEAVRLEGIIHVIGAINYLDQKLPPDAVTVSDVIMHMCIVRGFLVGSRRQMEDMVRAVEADDIHPVIDKQIFPFEKVKEGYNYLRQQCYIGKVAVSFD
ncbi:alcohol dehydrogenase [Fusarium pseudocircinatum]|uniref:Alcohol dehydrogenase n=1 Tax=Fusarium pseudocircinatum TaxID=56676 RepID=A0A8H5P852_9HYPO|nr:alcohol dehydrogenase [Fusarium pseudocircinatum]